MMGCPICDNKAANCDCTATEREQSDEIESLQAEIARLRDERRKWCTVDGYPGQFERTPGPKGDGNG